MNDKAQPDRDKVIANTGWGIKPDDQPANAADAGGGADKGLYVYEPGDADAVRNILRQQRRGFNTANRVMVEPGRVTIFDINGDPFVVEGLSYGDETLIELLKCLGASFDPEQVRPLGPDYDGVREYRLTKVWAWGAERTG